MSDILSTIRIILYKFGVAGMVMIAGFLVPRYLSVADNGIYKLTQLYFQLAYTYLSGYSFYYNFGLNRKGLDRRQLVAVIMRIYFWIALISALLLTAALLAIRVQSVFLYVAFAIATIPLAVLFTYATKLIQALNEISWLNRLNLVQGLLFLLFAVSLTFFGRHHDWISEHLLLLTLLSWLVSYLAAAVLAMISAFQLAGVSFRPENFPEITKMVFDYGKRVSFQQLLTQFNLRGDLMLVGIMGGIRATGLYAVAITASEVLWHISSSLSLLVYTRIAKEERKDSIALTERTFRYTLLLLIGSGLFLVVFFPPIIHFLLGRYDSSIPAFYILIVGSVAYGTMTLFTQFFTDQLGKVKFPMYVQTASIVTNVLLCVILIPHLYIEGAAIASSSAYFVGLFMNIGYFRMQTGRPLSKLLVFTRADWEVFRSRLRTSSPAVTPAASSVGSSASSPVNSSEGDRGDRHRMVPVEQVEDSMKHLVGEAGNAGNDMIGNAKSGSIDGAENLEQEIPTLRRLKEELHQLELLHDKKKQDLQDTMTHMEDEQTRLDQLAETGDDAK